MARKLRLFLPYAVYHVYCRVGRGEMVFACADEAAHWVTTVQEAARLHELKILAWCLMSNHYHLVLRSGVDPIWRPMAKIQLRSSRYHNRRLGVRGRMWQSRYKARIVVNDIYFDQVVAYVHLNPVAAGLVDDPADYRWSGHRELIGQTKPELVDARESLLAFGADLLSRREAYLTRVRQIQDERWFRQSVRKLPWWQPVADDEQTMEEGNAPQAAVRFDGARLALQEANRMELPSLQRWFEDALPSARDRLAARTQSQQDCHLRRLFAVLAVAELGHPSCEVAKVLHRSPSSVSRWLSDGLARRSVDPAFQREMDQLVMRLSAEISQQ